MKTLTLSGMACALALAFAGSANAQPVDVKALADRWTHAYNQHNAADVTALYSDNAELYVHGDQRVVGRRAIGAYWAEDMKVNSPLTVLTVTDSVVDAEMVLVHGNYQVLDRTSGVPQGFGRFAHIWVRDAGGQWRLDRDLWNQPVNGQR
jgi:ketosteroid isomerase-like protein